MQRSRYERLSLRRQSQGVTLLELMIVVVIIGLLSIVAIPSYRQYSIRAHRTEAKTALIRLATNQERFYLQNNTYTNDLVALGSIGGVSDKGVYTLTVPVADANSFQANAVATPGCASSTSTRTAVSTSFSPTKRAIRRTGSFRWKRAGRTSSSRASPTIRRRFR